jgi:hypothetical protein
MIGHDRKGVLLLLLLLLRRWAGRYYVRTGNRCAWTGAVALALLRGAPLSGLPPLAVVGRSRAGRWRWRRERRGTVALPLDTPLEAWATEAASLAVVKVAVVAHPCVRDDGADAEPDETGGTAEHSVVASVMVVPERVVVWHMM